MVYLDKKNSLYHAGYAVFWIKGCWGRQFFRFCYIWYHYLLICGLSIHQVPMLDIFSPTAPDVGDLLQRPNPRRNGKGAASSNEVAMGRHRQWNSVTRTRPWHAVIDMSSSLEDIMGTVPDGVNNLPVWPMLLHTVLVLIEIRTSRDLVQKL